MNHQHTSNHECDFLNYKLDVGGSIPSSPINQISHLGNSFVAYLFHAVANAVIKVF